MFVLAFRIELAASKFRVNEFRSVATKINQNYSTVKMYVREVEVQLHSFITSVLVEGRG